MRRFAALIFGLLLAGTVRAGGADLEGNWKFTFMEDGEPITLWILQFESKDNKVAGTALPLKKVPPTKVEDAKTEGDLLKFRLNVGNRINFEFEGKLPRAGGKKILGSLARAGAPTLPAYLEATPAKNNFELDRELVRRTPYDPRVFQSVLGLIRQAKDEKATPKDVGEWAQAALKTADLYGPRWQLDYSLTLAETLAGPFPEIAADIAAKVEAALPATAPADQRLRVLTTLQEALAKAGKKDEAAKIESRMEELEKVDYAQYMKKNLDFKIDAFAGRKAKSDRAVLVELFTGAQCPPCVAADIGFDGLEKTFSPREVVLLQYHLHVPGPDALTNPATEERQEYYGRLVRGTPTILFNGKDLAPGGGFKDDAPNKYREYVKVIEPLLEKAAPVQVQVEAVRKGDKVEIKAKVAGLDKPGEKIKLRLALVEDHVRYKGRNGLVYHSKVVRDMPGGAKGIALAKKDFEYAATVDLAELRQNLSKYLNEFERVTGETFPDTQRPMRLQGLGVVAFVQDDATEEVLQAASAPVTGK